MALIEGDIRNFRQLIFLQKYFQDHNGFIAGGCFKDIFQGNKVKDLDVFFRSEEDFIRAERKFNGITKTEGTVWVKYYKSKNVTAFIHKNSGIVLEFIKTTYGTPEEILNQFDFTIAKFAFYTETITHKPEDGFQPEEEIRSVILYHDKFFEHLSLKRLVVDNEMPFPVSTFHRMIRYIEYGFKPCKETRIYLLTMINQLDASEFDAGGFGTLYEGLD